MKYISGKGFLFWALTVASVMVYFASIIYSFDVNIFCLRLQKKLIFKMKAPVLGFGRALAFWFSEGYLYFWVQCFYVQKYLF